MKENNEIYLLSIIASSSNVLVREEHNMFVDGMVVFM